MTENILACDGCVQGWQLLHCETQKPGGLAGKGAFTAINVIYGMRTWAHLARTVVTRRPSLSHLPLAQNKLGFLRDAILLVSAKALGSRVLAHAHGGDFHTFFASEPAWRRRLIGWVLGKADGVAIIGRSLSHQFAGLVPEERLAVIPNCIALERLPPERTDHGARADSASPPLTVLFLGKISVAKGAVIFVKAAEALLRSPVGSRFRFRMVGDFLEIERNITFVANPHGVRRQIEHLLQLPHCRNAIAITGSLEGEAKWQEYARADIFVSPSYSEGFPLTILEAMSMRLPIVATSVGAIRELIGPHQQPFIVEPGDVDALADAISTLAADPQRRRDLGDANRRHVESAYDLPALARYLAAAYDQTARV